MSLILVRHTGESIQVDNHINVKVIEVYRNKVVLAVDAPKHVPVDRWEIHVKKQENLLLTPLQN